jgi:hypothetical protein
MYGFLPKEFLEKYPFAQYIAVIIALFLLIVFVRQEIITYLNYSYADVSKEGNILRCKNFKYKIKKDNDKEGTIYLILGKYDIDNLCIKAHNAVTPEVSVAIAGVKIKFIASGFGNPIVESSFKIEIKK